MGGQDSISVIASQFYISSNKQKLLANVDQRDSKVLLLIVTSSMNRYLDSSVDKIRDRKLNLLLKRYLASRLLQG